MPFFGKSPHARFWISHLGVWRNCADYDCPGGHDFVNRPYTSSIFEPTRGNAEEISPPHSPYLNMHVLMSMRASEKPYGYPDQMKLLKKYQERNSEAVGAFCINAKQNSPEDLSPQEISDFQSQWHTDSFSYKSTFPVVCTKSRRSVNKKR
jgi:hypothetical protein